MASALGIDVQVLRAQRQVRRLKPHLDGIRFGIIHGDPHRDPPHRSQAHILSALRLGEAHELLFMAAIPDPRGARRDIPSLRAACGGLLQAQRPARLSQYLGSPSEIAPDLVWPGSPPARPAIHRCAIGGVGAALMMSGLTSGSATHICCAVVALSGSLRFLFLDRGDRRHTTTSVCVFERICARTSAAAPDRPPRLPVRKSHTT